MHTAPRSRLIALALGVMATLLVGRVSMPARGGGVGGEVKGKQATEDFSESVRTVHLSMPISSKAAKTWLKLRESIDVSFPNETPLEDFLKYLKEATRGKDKKEPGIPIYVDPVGLNEAEKTMTSPIVIDLEDIPAATALELTLRQLHLRYYVEQEGIVMITAEGLEAPGTMEDATALLLDSLSALQGEVAALRREVGALRKGR